MRNRAEKAGIPVILTSEVAQPLTLRLALRRVLKITMPILVVLAFVGVINPAKLLKIAVPILFVLLIVAYLIYKWSRHIARGSLKRSKNRK